VAAAPSDLRLVYRSDLSPAATFRELASTLGDALARVGFAVDLRAGGALGFDGRPVAEVSGWAGGRELELRGKAMPLFRRSGGSPLPTARRA